MTRSCYFALIGLVFALTFVGCTNGPQDLPDLGTVTGTVTMDGEPLPNASVEFISASGQVASGTTDASGKYELAYVGGSKGAEIGENTVRITTVLDAPAPPGYKDPIPAKYNEASELKVTVEAGKNTHDFALES